MQPYAEFQNDIRSELVADCHPAEFGRHPDDPWGDEEERLAVLQVPTHGVVTFPEQLTQALAWPVADLPALNRAANTTFNVPVGWAMGPIDMSRVYRVLAKATFGSGTGALCTATGAFFAGNTTNTLQTFTGAAWTWTQVTAGATMNVANIANVTICTAEIRADQLPSGTRYLAFVINNQSACTFSAEMIAAGGAYRPTSQFNNTVNLGQSVT
jgi:hypothetical protein